MTDSQSAVRARQFYQQGIGFYSRGQLSEAVDALRHAIRAASDHVDARIQLGIVLVARGKAAEGLEVIETGLARRDLQQPDRIRLLVQASSCAAAANQYQDARAYLERAMELGGMPDAHILNQVAAICCKGGEFDVGFDYFLKAATSGSSPEE
ncbi:MAG: hypothetical protein JW797_05490 [Bradymonadales bacterium]|nr:hypothetical protein [Bradymonadales bacterium]